METDIDISLLFTPKDNPALINSGYGKLAKYIAPRLQRAGHTIRLHCRVGHSQNIMHWEDPYLGEDLEIWSGGNGPYGEEIIPNHLNNLHAETQEPPVLFFIGDVEALSQVPAWLDQNQFPGITWAAVDWEHPTPQNILQKLQAWDKVWTMSQFSHEVLQQDGLDNLLDPVWLGVNPSIFQPIEEDLPKTKRDMGYGDDTFNVVSVFANQYQRKGEQEMFTTIAEFHKRHPEANIRFYGMTQRRREWDLPALLDHLGLRDIVTLSDDYHYVMGNYLEQDISRMFNAADLCLSLGYEGFGLQTIEAQACGTPVIGFEAAATPELHKSGIRVPPKKELMRPNLIKRQLPDERFLLAALEISYERIKNTRLSNPYYLEDPRITNQLPDSVTEREHLGAGFPSAVDWVHNNLTWDHAAEALLDRLDQSIDHIIDQEKVGPPGPGPLANDLANDIHTYERSTHVTLGN